jgi:hypothetical protein
MMNRGVITMNKRYSSMLMISGLLLLMPFLEATPVHADYSYTNVQYYYNHYWAICNYDVHATSGWQPYNCPQNQGKLDHPVTLVFTGNAGANKIYSDLLQKGYGCCGDSSYAAIYSGVSGNPDAGAYYEGSGGYKTPNGCSTTSYHLRVYGTYTSPSRGVVVDYLYDPYWNDFNFATTHEDINESCGSQASYTGYENDAAYKIAIDLFSFSNVASYNQYWTWFNNEQDASHPNRSGGATYGYCDANSATGVEGYWYFAPGTPDNECAESRGYVGDLVMTGPVN